MKWPFFVTVMYFEGPARGEELRAHVLETLKDMNQPLPFDPQTVELRLAAADFRDKLFTRCRCIGYFPSNAYDEVVERILSDPALPEAGHYNWLVVEEVLPGFNQEPDSEMWFFLPEGGECFVEGTRPKGLEMFFGFGIG